ncbi:MAG: prepilin-type N-terminal cleavage/methylation domain-containing protein [Phycisphaerales bacterium]
MIMNAQYPKNLKGFSLVELLVVIAIIAILLSIMIPSLSRARQQARIVVVNHELNQIGLALEAYEFSNHDWPMVRPDCGNGAENMYSLPPELIKGGYLPGHKKGLLLYNDIEDKFYKGHSYRYLTVGPTINAYGKATSLKMPLLIPLSYPSGTCSELKEYSEKKDSPIKWIVFSVGPNYDFKNISRGFPFDKGFPSVKDFWYTPQTKKGLLLRIKLKNDQHIGTFQKSK